MSHIDPYHLAQLAAHFWSGQPHGPATRIEPILGGPENIREDPARARTGKSRGLDIFQMPQPPTTQNQKKAAAREQLAHDLGVKAVGDALRPGAIEPDASEAPTQALGAEAVDSGLDKELTRQWIERMRAARENKKATPPDKPPPEPAPKYITDKFGESVHPWMNDEDEIRWHGEQAVKEALFPPPADPRAGQAGENAVAKALRDIDMKPLIDHALAVQRAQAIRDMILSHLPPNTNLPESYIPENMNRPPGNPNSVMRIYDPTRIQETSVPGVLGTSQVRTPLSPGEHSIGRIPGNFNPAGMFPPQAPHDPNLPPGPHVRSPGKPEDEPPVVE